MASGFFHYAGIPDAVAYPVPCNEGSGRTELKATQRAWQINIVMLSTAPAHQVHAHTVARRRAIVRVFSEKPERMAASQGKVDVME